MEPKYTNALIHETSPYLLQHAHNPVKWEAWNPQVLQKARAADKPLLISIGYAACHWCHVMEHECFEDIEVAKVMNDNFVNIKIDREERPDVDHIYMDALQMMTGSGGWPLNIVAMPDGKPFWGATYVKKHDWINVLQQLADLYKKDRSKVSGYAENLADGIRAINLVEPQGQTESYNLKNLEAAVNDWLRYFDTVLGGYKRAPKFMMPVNLNFLLHYGVAQGNKEVLAYVNTTLTKMAWGGIFDHVGGGFSRYSVDIKWHVPHFEKMLYDNGQLISLYAQAYAVTKNKLYKEVTERTIAFAIDELMDGNHGFYSSLDADSLNTDGALEEGAYYVWTEKQLISLLGKNYDVFKDYFNINSYGHWEHDNYVLIRDAPKEEIARKHELQVGELDTIITDGLQILKKERGKRNRPRLDDKILTSWNGLFLKGLTDAYRYLGNKEYLILALKNANFIHQYMSQKDGGLYHNHKNGRSTINGYLEDYATVIEAFISLYEVTCDEQWIYRSRTLTDYCLEHFHDTKTALFFFTSKKDEALIRRTMETTDNVIPASNSIMGKNLFKLSRFFPECEYGAIALQMVKSIGQNLEKHYQNHANWLDLLLFHEKPFYEIVVAGPEYEKKHQALLRHYLPNTILAATEKESELSVLKQRTPHDGAQIYVCEHGSCKLPVNEVEEALALMKEPAPH